MNIEQLATTPTDPEELAILYEGLRDPLLAPELERAQREAPELLAEMRAAWLARKAI